MLSEKVVKALDLRYTTAVAFLKLVIAALAISHKNLDAQDHGLTPEEVREIREQITGRGTILLQAIETLQHEGVIMALLSACNQHSNMLNAAVDEEEQDIRLTSNRVAQA